jgi:hypothetical protein
VAFYLTLGGGGGKRLPSLSNWTSAFTLAGLGGGGGGVEMFELNFWRRQRFAIFIYWWWWWLAVFL